MLITLGKTNWRYILIVIILATILFGGLLIYVKRHTEEISSSSKASGEFANLSLFTNTKYNYSFLYPSNDYVTTEFIENYKVIGDLVKTADRIIVLIKNHEIINEEPMFNLQVRTSEMYSGAPSGSAYKSIVNLDLKTFTEKIWEYNKDIDKNHFLADKKVGEIVKTTIGGKEAYQFSLTSGYVDWEGGYVLTQPSLYAFVANAKGDKFVIWFPLDNEQAYKILETFRFTN